MIEDETDEATTIIMGKQAEELFGTTCEDLILKKNYKNPNVLPSEILQAQGQIKLLKLKVGTLQNFVVKGVFQDVQPQNIQPLSSTADKIASTKKRNLETSGKQLFETNPNKNLKSDKHSQPSSIEEKSTDSSEVLM